MRPDLRVPELAAGTGLLIRTLATRLPASATPVATDLDPPMLATAVAAAALTERFGHGEVAGKIQALATMVNA